MYYLCHLRDSIHKQRVRRLKEVLVVLVAVTNEVFPASVSQTASVYPKASSKAGVQSAVFIFWGT